MIDASGNIFIEILEANVRNPNKENFKIFFADDMTEIKAKDSEGNIIPFAGSGGGAGNTIYNADDSLISDRTVEGAGFSLNFINLLQFTARATDINFVADTDVNIFGTTGKVFLEARTEVVTRSDQHNFKNGAGVNLFYLDVDGRARTKSDVVTWFEDTSTPTPTGGLAINLNWGVSGWKNDLVIFPNDTTNRVSVRAFAIAGQNNELGLARSPGNNDGFRMLFDGNPAGLGRLYCEGDIELITSGATGRKTIRLKPQNLPNTGLEVTRDAIGTDYIFNNIRTYISTALAQADGTLPVGAIYNLTTGPGGGNSVRIKV